MVDEEGEEDTEEEEGAAGGGGGGGHHRDHQENPSFSPIRSGVDGIPGTIQSHTQKMRAWPVWGLKDEILQTQRSQTPKVYDQISNCIFRRVWQPNVFPA